MLSGENRYHSLDGISFIQKIKQYIAQTEMDEEAASGYEIGLTDILALCDVADRDTCGAICYTFLFGKAMGYRAAKGI